MHQDEDFLATGHIRTSRKTHMIQITRTIKSDSRRPPADEARGTQSIGTSGHYLRLCHGGGTQLWKCASMEQVTPLVRKQHRPYEVAVDSIAIQHRGHRSGNVLAYHTQQHPNLPQSWSRRVFVTR